MSHSVATKLEIDVMLAKELPDAVDLAVRHRMPALIVHQELIGATNLLRARKQGKFKIITPIDWPKGDRVGVEKFTHVNIDAMNADGFEIILNQHKSVSAALGEINPITSVLKNYMQRPVEIRYCIEATDRPQENWEVQCEAFGKVPAPDFIRTTHLVSLQQSKANATVSQALLEKIRAKTSRPIKLSGNVQNIKTVAMCKAARYGVSFKQALELLDELKEYPERYKELTEPVTIQPEDPALLQ